MERVYQSPGVYRPAEEIVLKSSPQLVTGVPGFVGFINAGSKLVPRLSAPVTLNRQSEFDGLLKSQPGPHLPDGGFLAEAVNGFFLNGGARCYVICTPLSESTTQNAKDLSDTIAKNADALAQALELLSSSIEMDLIAIPDLMMLAGADGSPDVDTVTQVQRAALAFCQMHGNCFAILDALPDDVLPNVVDQRRNLSQGFNQPINGALYYPWLRVTSDRRIPPSGHIAGIFARSDARSGVFKAPANEEILGAIDLTASSTGDLSELKITSQIQDQLNPEGINCLRAFPGRGIRVWGARSLNSDANWRYINVCRLVITLRRWIEMNMAWVSFEPNTPQLWVRIARELTSYLTDLRQAGALAGGTAAEGFYIKCDSETNSQQEIDAGKVVTEIGLAPTVPAEFVVVRIVHHIGVEPR